MLLEFDDTRSGASDRDDIRCRLPTIHFWKVTGSCTLAGLATDVGGGAVMRFWAPA